jgi:predicted AAA+ superfamily ATPase
MDYIPRQLDLKQATSQKSCFLFGPRQTGKSSLIAHELPDANLIDLLDDEIYLRLQTNPKTLATYIDHPRRVRESFEKRASIYLEDGHGPEPCILSCFRNWGRDSISRKH